MESFKHEFNGPASKFVGWFAGEWGEESKLHREDGPALLEYDLESGELLSETWYYKGLLHRLDGPTHYWVTDPPNGGDRPPTVYNVYDDSVGMAAVKAARAGVITDEQLKQIQAKVSEAEQLEVLRLAVEGDAP